MIHNISRFIAALALLATAQGAWADTETVSYIDADGNEQTVTATVLTGDVTADGLKTDAWGAILIPAGWYVVKNSKDGVDASYTAQLCYTGDNGTIHLILADGAEMTVSKSTNHAIYLDHGYPLAIYGQSGGTGRLTVTGKSNAIYALGGITINGGIVNVIATGTDSNAHAIYVMNGITINGGQVTATTAGSGKGIYVYETASALTIGCRKASDFVSYSSRGGAGKVNIKSGQTLYAGATAYSGNNVSLPTGAVTLRTFSSDYISVSGDEYTIKNAAGWNLFCDFLQDNDSWNRFSGKTVRLGADITVTRMAGSQYHDFCGTFDGGGNTLTVTLSGSSDRMAPFSYISNVGSAPAAIRNLNVVADITSSGQNASALVGEAWGELTIEQCTVSGTVAVSKQFAGGIIGSASNTSLNISNCISSVTISSSKSGDGTHGGFAGRVPSSATLNISGCVFDGKIITTSGTTNCGGFVGHSENTAGSNVSITNSLYAPTADDQTVSEGCETFCRNIADGHITNCYYTRALGTAQGKAPRTVAADTDVTIEPVALIGTATQYTVSGITAYSGGGLQRGETLYYGSDDQLSLTLSNSATGAPQGYQYGYTASAGTLSGSTLTMPDQDVTISVNTTALAPIDWATVNEGDSEEDPYMIYNKDQLLLLAHRVNGTNGETANTYEGKYFKLGADITFDYVENEGDDYAENYEAIGGYIGGTYRDFRGTFDGDGYTVSGIRIRKDGSGIDYIDQGLFGCIDSGAEIYDVHLTDARITGYDCVGGIAGSNNGGYIMRCTVTDSYITATHNWLYGTICGVSGVSSNTDRLTNNYYHGCTVNGTPVTSGMGYMGADITANNGALPAYAIALGANITTPPGTFAGQTEWLDTPPASPRLAPENGFTLAGNHYFASGYEFTPGSTLASGAAQGYTPRATLGDELLDLYTPTGDADLLAGKAIARLTITADCDGKTLASTEAIYSTGQPVTVAYIKADGTADEASAIALDGHETVDEYGDVHLAAGTYYVGTDIAYANPIQLNGNITLILCDGCTMNVGESGAPIEDANVAAIDGFENGDKTFTIYGQTLGTGALNVYASGTTYPVAISVDALTVNGGNIIADFNGTEIANPILSYGDININRGTVTATATGDESYGIYAYNGTVNINGGTVTANGTENSIYGIAANINGGTITANDGIYVDGENGDVAINGGNVTASSIYSESGTITLGWTDYTDRITASSISAGTVAVADGQALTDGSGNIYTGTLTAADLDALADKTLQPSVIALAAREAPDGNYWTTYYNSALGFTINADEYACAYTAEYDGANSQLTLHKLGTVIPKGTAVIIVGGDNSISLTASNETATVPTNNLHGVDVRKEKSTLGTGTFYVMSQKGDNFGFFEYTGEYMPARKAYLLINGSAALTRGLTMVFDDETTGIRPTPGPSLNGGEWHDLSGRRLDGKKPTKKGVYIHDGKKVVIK